MIKQLNSLFAQKMLNPEELDKIKELLETKYSDVYNYYIGKNEAAKNDFNLMYRSHKTNGMWFTAKPEFRKSLGSTNVHTVLMSEILPSWKKYPKRNHCFIGSTDINSSDTYIEGEGNYNGEKRNFYVILPKNNTKIALCYRDDLWNSFEFMSELLAVNTLEKFDEVFENMIIHFARTANIKNIGANDISDMFDQNNTKLILEILALLKSLL